MIDPFALGVPRGVDALIRRAIAERRLLRCVFDGHERIGQPHDYGIFKGRVELFMWQLRGTSKHGDLPGWRPLRLAESDGFIILEQRFSGQRPPPTGKHRQWDELWARVQPAEEQRAP